MAPLPISKLIELIGDENIEMQNLDEATETYDRAKFGTKARFVTTVGFSMDGFDKLGLILWIDRDKAAAALAKHKEENPNG